MQRNRGSFRDRSGVVFEEEYSVKRTLNHSYAPHWTFVSKTGLLTNLLNTQKLISFEECETLPDTWKTLESPRIPFISYPYEWSFSQVKDAALLTLHIQTQALKHGCTLKDASAYNVQFVGNKPLFIDLLSFEERRQDAPWVAYAQFCSHFLTPLALASYVSVDCLLLMRDWLEGIPLDLTTRLLPSRCRLNPRLFWHLYLHAKIQGKFSDVRKTKKDTKQIKVSQQTVEGIATSLTNLVENLKAPQAKTEWSHYYDDTNYTKGAHDEKQRIVEQTASKHQGKTALDLGANTGIYSAILARHFEYVVSIDIDRMAIEKQYTALKASGPHNILPIVQDLSNPSPGLGWNGEERMSFLERCRNIDFVAALALIHHLTISSNVPFPMAADFFNRLLKPSGYLLLEFVPKSDSQVQRMLSTRVDIFCDYSLEHLISSFGCFFRLEQRFEIHESERLLLLFQKTSTELTKERDK